MSSWFRGLKLKLLCLISVAFLGMLGLFWKGYSTAHKLHDQLDIIKDQRLTITDNMGDFKEETGAIFKFFWLSLNRFQLSLPAEEHFIMAKELVTESYEEIDSLNKFEINNEIRANLEEARKILNNVEKTLARYESEVLKAQNPKDPQVAKTIAEITEEMPQKGSAILALIEKSDDLMEKENEILSKTAEATFDDGVWWISLLGGVTFLVFLSFGLILAQRLVKGLTIISNKVEETTRSVNSASQQLASSSQQLASASQQQASSVEETSSSLEEISGIVQSSVKHSQKSVELSQQIHSLVNLGNQSMEELNQAMKQIAEANEKVESLAKRIEEIGEKTELIDEIVFQTRLLSFNASVEAERAGEYGRGFAVVAQEVGNLAQMSGKSALEINQIVKTSIREARESVEFNRQKVEQGVAICKKTSEQLGHIEEASKSVLQSSEQILRATQEQSGGIQQINQSIQLISQATQENASSAEECSSASRSLTEQGDQLSMAISELNVLIHGSLEPDNVDSKISTDSPATATPSAVVALSHHRKNRSYPKTSSSRKGSAKPQDFDSLDKTGTDDPWEKL